MFYLGILIKSELPYLNFINHPSLLLGKGRIESLTDGIFATVMTVLVLSFNIPAIVNTGSLQSYVEVLRAIVFSGALLENMMSIDRNLSGGLIIYLSCIALYLFPMIRGPTVALELYISALVFYVLASTFNRDLSGFEDASRGSAHDCPK
jgi:hypothetical protein